MHADDRRLLTHCLEGRKEAWDEMVERFSPYIYYLIHATLGRYGHGGDHEAVDEIHNGVFLAILEDDMRRLRSFRGDNGCTLRSWLRLIAIRKTVDHLKALRPMSSLDAEDAEGVSQLDALASDAPDAEAMLIALESPHQAEVIAAAIEALSPADRELYELFFVQGLAAEQVAETLGVAKGTVYTRKSRLIDRMSRGARAQGLLGEARGR